MSKKRGSIIDSHGSVFSTEIKEQSPKAYTGQLLEKDQLLETAFFLVPTPGRIIVQEDQFQEHSRIITPDSAKRRPTTGKILAVGEGVYDMLKVDTRVVYGLYSGTVINFKNQPAFRILGQDEVLSIVKGADLILEGVGV